MAGEGDAEPLRLGRHGAVRAKEQVRVDLDEVSPLPHRLGHRRTRLCPVTLFATCSGRNVSMSRAPCACMSHSPRNHEPAAEVDHPHPSGPRRVPADGDEVRIRFQDIPGDFDPSIADVWSLPPN